MSTEYARTQARRWGWIVLLALAYFLGEAWMGLDDDLVEISGLQPPIYYAERISQLRPAMFKFPWAGVYLGIFLVMALALAVGCLYSGARAVITDEEEPGA